MSALETELAKHLVECRQLFSNYQTLPKFIADSKITSLSNFDYKANQLSLDMPRYEFLTSQLGCSSLRVVEIGSNLGFFCLSLAKDFSCRTTGFEPISQYAKAASIMAEIGGLERRCEFSNQTVALQDIKSLPPGDLYIELNVMHHAGVVFDKAEFQKFANWKDYAIARLSEYQKKSQMLLFQTGNTSNGKTLFPTSNSVQFVADIIEQSGWNVLSVGTISDLATLDYVQHNIDQLEHTTAYNCQRNATSNLVDYFIGNELCGSLITGLAARPIWLCQSKA